MKKILPWPFIIVLFAGCGSTGVVPIGRDGYMVTNRSATIMASGSEMMADLFKEATEYCEKQGKAMKVLNESKLEPIPFVRGASAELRFRCE